MMIFCRIWIAMAVRSFEITIFFGVYSANYTYFKSNILCCADCILCFFCTLSIFSLTRAATLQRLEQRRPNGPRWSNFEGTSAKPGRCHGARGLRLWRHGGHWRLRGQEVPAGELRRGSVLPAGRQRGRHPGPAAAFCRKAVGWQGTG